MDKPLVTLLCPCYNAQEFLDRFLNSLFNQSYTNIQIIMIDDGSKDKTLEILCGYSEKMKKFSEYTILKKENGGAASAVNMALPYVKGKYLTWADCDDVLYPENIEKKVYFLECNVEYGLVNCQAESFYGTVENKYQLLAIPKSEQKENIFFQLINPGVPCYPGVFMVRTELLLKRIPDRKIVYHREVGQNWQLLLPVAYDHKCGYIDEPLYGYCLRMDSHSHDTDYKRSIQRTYYGNDILSKVIEFIDDDEYKRAMLMADHVFSLRRLNAAFQYCDRTEFRKNFKHLKNIGYRMNRKLICKNILINLPGGMAFKKWIEKRR